VSESRTEAHALRSFAKRIGINVSYPLVDPQTELF
jgi:hypothetical protein